MSCWLCWAGLALVVLLVLCYFVPIINYYVRSVYYLLALIIAGTIGALLSVPFGRTPNNHYRMFNVFHLFTWVLGIKYEIRHEERMEEVAGPYIVIANHQSAIDVLSLTWMWPQNCVVMLKSSLKYLPGFNLCGFLCNSLFIDRFSKENAHRTLDKTTQAIEKDKRRVWIFPEGTRNNTLKMLAFKKGAFLLAHKLQVPILCIIYSSHLHLFNQKTYKFTSGRIVAEFLPPVDSKKFETVEDLAKHCQEYMQKELDRLNAEVDASYKQ